MTEFVFLTIILSFEILNEYQQDDEFAHQIFSSFDLAKQYLLKHFDEYIDPSAWKEENIEHHHQICFKYVDYENDLIFVIKKLSIQNSI